MANTAERRATYADIVALPENKIGEIMGGELYVQARPASRHTGVASALGADLVGPFQRGRGGPGGWWILDEPELHLNADVLVPDLGGWRRERMPVFPDVAGFELAPDWVCEVLSPSTEKIDRATKLPIYANHGVGHVWLIDPSRKTLEAFRLESGRWVLLGVWTDSETVRVEPFDAVPLSLELLWNW